MSTNLGVYLGRGAGVFHCFLLFTVLGCAGNLSSRSILHVSFDPTREMFQQLNGEFLQQWRTDQIEEWTIYQSHGPSGRQARAVIDGLQADVVSLALSSDIDAIAARSEQIAPDWSNRFPNQSCAYSSTIVFVVRPGNPKAIRDWVDLARPGVAVITPNPTTSGGARWNYLAAWASARRRGADEAEARRLVRAIYANAPVLEAAARAAANTFVLRGIGDVLITWENEAHLIQKRLGKDSAELVYPAFSIRADTPMALVDAVAEKRGSETFAEAYIQFMYTPQAQRIIAGNFFRPSDRAIAAEFRDQFPEIEMADIDRDLGGWQASYERHFRKGGEFDQIYADIERNRE